LGNECVAILGSSKVRGLTVIVEVVPYGSPVLAKLEEVYMEVDGLVL
jgi:hypothetical protein